MPEGKGGERHDQYHPREHAGGEPEPRPWPRRDGGRASRGAQATRAIAVGLASSLRLMLLMLGLLACVLPLHLIPVYGSLAATLASAAITIWFLSLQFTAYSMDRRFYSYAQRKDFLRENRARSVGLGTMAFLVMMVPVLNALFIPVSAVAGTLLFCDTALGGARAGR
jgi:uncharacterized protein involved in cysteine biosynthesis